MKDQLIAAGKSYLRSAAACVGALYLSGITDPKVLANALTLALPKKSTLPSVLTVVTHTI